MFRLLVLLTVPFNVNVEPAPAVMLGAMFPPVAFESLRVSALFITTAPAPAVTKIASAAAVVVFVSIVNAEPEIV
jgi:hypothetical protein